MGAVFIQSGRCLVAFFSKTRKPTPVPEHLGAKVAFVSAEGDYVTIPIEPEDPAEEWTPEQRDKFIAELEESMSDAAKRFEFEKAAQLRDRIKVLKSLGIHEESPVGGPNRHG